MTTQTGDTVEFGTRTTWPDGHTEVRAATDRRAAFNDARMVNSNDDTCTAVSVRRTVSAPTAPETEVPDGGTQRWGVRVTYPAFPQLAGLRIDGHTEILAAASRYGAEFLAARAAGGTHATAAELVVQIVSPWVLLSADPT